MTKNAFFDLGLSLANPLRMTSLFKKIIPITRKATALDWDERMMQILKIGSCKMGATCRNLKPNTKAILTHDDHLESSLKEGLKQDP